MARNITQFFRPTIAADRYLKYDDLIHIGRSSGTDFEKDATLTGEQLFNTVNVYGGLFGAPTAPTSLVANVAAQVSGYASSSGAAASLDETAGTITITETGLYRVNAMMLFDNNQVEVGFVMFLQNSTQPDLVMGALDIPAKSNGYVSLNGNTVISLTVGDVLNLALQSDSNPTLTHANASFDVTPLQI